MSYTPDINGGHMKYILKTLMSLFLINNVNAKDYILKDMVLVNLAL